MKIIFLILSIYILLYNQTYASDIEFLDKNLTIKELSKNIEKLKDKNIEFQEKNKELSKEHWELISFIKTDLTDKEIEEIKQKVEIFIWERNSLQKKLKEKINNLENTTEDKKNIIIHRANFYKYIAKFVQKEKREDFIAHIKFHIQSEKESKDLIEEILKNQNILEKKVTHIKWKIENHKDDLQINIENEINSKIKKRIYEINNDPKFKSIDKKIKNKIYIDTINWIKDKLKDIDNSHLSENYKEMKKNIFNKIINEIQAKIIE